MWPALFLILLPLLALLTVLVLRPHFTVERTITPPVVGAGRIHASRSAAVAASPCRNASLRAFGRRLTCHSAREAAARSG